MTDETIEPSLAESRSREVTEAVLAEREACARLLEGDAATAFLAGEKATSIHLGALASAIRSRPAVDPTGGVTSPDYVPKRVETGVVQFEGDWPGVFIRGDNAMNFAMSMRRLFSARVDANDSAISMAVVGNFLKLLERANKQHPEHKIDREIPLSAAPLGEKIGYQWVYRQKDGSLELGSADINDADDPPYAAEFSELVGKAEIILLSSPTTSPSAISEAPTSADAVERQHPSVSIAAVKSWQEEIARLREALRELLNVPELADIYPEDRSEECWAAERKARAAVEGTKS